MNLFKWIPRAWTATETAMTNPSLRHRHKWLVNALVCLLLVLAHPAYSAPSTASEAQKITRQALQAEYHPLFRPLPTPVLRFFSETWDKMRIRRLITQKDKKDLLVVTAQFNTPNPRSGSTLLHRAIVRADLPDFERLIAQGADPYLVNKQGVSSLALAQKLHFWEKVPQAVKDRISDRHTLQQCLARFSPASPEFLQAIDQLERDPQHPSAGSNLLQRAVQQDDRYLMETLLVLKADPLKPNAQGKSAIDLLTVKNAWGSFSPQLQFLWDQSRLESWLKEFPALAESTATTPPLPEIIYRLNQVETLTGETLLHRSLRTHPIYFSLRLLRLGASLLVPNRSGQHAFAFLQKHAAWDEGRRGFTGNVKHEIDQSFVTQLLAHSLHPVSPSEIARQLNQASETSGSTLLHRALARHSDDLLLVSTLLTHGANPLQADRQGFSPLGQLLKEDHWQQTPELLKNLLAQRLQTQIVGLAAPYSWLSPDEFAALFHFWISQTPTAQHLTWLAELQDQSLKQKIYDDAERSADPQTLLAITKLNLIPRTYTPEILAELALDAARVGMPEPLLQALKDSAAGRLRRGREIELRLTGLSSLVPFINSAQDCQLVKSFLAKTHSYQSEYGPQDAESLAQLKKLEQLTDLPRQFEALVNPMSSHSRLLSAPQLAALRVANRYLKLVTSHFLKLHFNLKFLQAQTQQQFKDYSHRHSTHALFPLANPWQQVGSESFRALLPGIQAFLLKDLGRAHPPAHCSSPPLIWPFRAEARPETTTATCSSPVLITPQAIGAELPGDQPLLEFQQFLIHTFTPVQCLPQDPSAAGTHAPHTFSCRLVFPPASPAEQAAEQKTSAASDVLPDTFPSARPAVAKDAPTPEMAPPQAPTPEPAAQHPAPSAPPWELNEQGQAAAEGAAATPDLPTTLPIPDWHLPLMPLAPHQLLPYPAASSQGCPEFLVLPGREHGAL